MLSTKARMKTTELPSRISKRRLAVLGQEYPEQPGVDYERPRRRGDCEPGGRLHIRPCPFVSCGYHLAVEVNERNGSITYTFGTDDIASLRRHTCALDMVDSNPGGMTLDALGEAYGVTRERVRQMVGAAIESIRSDEDNQQFFSDSE